MEDDLEESQVDFCDKTTDTCGNRRQVILHFDIGYGSDLPVLFISTLDRKLITEKTCWISISMKLLK